jgi:hypothetical protein
VAAPGACRPELRHHAGKAFGPVTGAKTVTIGGNAMNNLLLHKMCHKLPRTNRSHFRRTNISLRRELYLIAG